MSDAEHLIENAIIALERYPFDEAERYFMEKPINIMMSKDSGCSLNAVWEMAIYCDTTLRQDWKEKWEKEAERWIPVTERLPEKDGQFVLTFRYNGTGNEIDVHFHRNDMPGVFQKLDGLVRTYNVTHWKPLPEPPKEKQ